MGSDDPAKSRERLHTILVTGAGPDAHDALLVALLHSTSQVKAALSGAGTEQRRAGARRARAIAGGLKDDPVVKARYDAAMAAVMTTVVTSAVVTTAAGT